MVNSVGEHGFIAEHNEIADQKLYYLKIKDQTVLDGDRND